ncbi:hypothetical protein OG884_20950 [Streptosporangium sp. NBC_01755]|uniref:hypothetical protein n=1 Tax=unclassified Streptosporangium TaxID=2632669 RepID=UPI002DD8F1B4|nr:MULTISPECIES: hypothetical protein [unclassified Streptosporangium]WSA24562.1 hypothetical protein OIE13_26970 [Streptosporangium sp. NBC_01810]WSC97364.1 hypothetical protein OG884_20950 [Streptosporangium sp. NBC_01755]
MTLLQRLGDGQVLKLMSASRSTPIRWLTADDVQALHVGRYIEELRTVGVQLPADVRIVKSGRRPAVQHLWIPGTPLPDLAAHHPVLFTSAVRQIAAWVAALDSSGARLDTNLANFVINPDDGLVCIDVLPPLLTDLRPPEHDDWQRLFGGLCYDTDITMCALAGYAARALLAAHGTGVADHIPDLAGLCPGHTHPDRLPVHWFHLRQKAAVVALCGEIPPRTALKVFTATSVLRLRNTPTAARQARIDAGLAAMHRLDPKGSL